MKDHRHDLISDTYKVSILYVQKSISKYCTYEVRHTPSTRNPTTKNFDNHIQRYIAIQRQSQSYERKIIMKKQKFLHRFSENKSILQGVLLHERNAKKTIEERKRRAKHETMIRTVVFKFLDKCLRVLLVT
jgi:hypothetical protein